MIFTLISRTLFSRCRAPGVPKGVRGVRDETSLAFATVRQLDYEAVGILGVTWDHLPHTGTPLLKGPVPLPGELDLLGAPCLHYASFRRDEFGEGFRKGAGLWLLRSGGGTAVVGDFGGAGAQEAR